MHIPARVHIAGLILAALAPAVAGIAGCSADKPTSRPSTSAATATVASSAPTTTPRTVEPQRPVAMPPVPRTFELTRFRERTCALVPAASQAELQLPAPTSAFETCTWQKPQLTVTIELLVNVSFMRQVYAQSNTDTIGGEKKWVLFEPITIDGQPALLLKTTTQPDSMLAVVATSPVDCIMVSVTTQTRDPRVTAIAVAEQAVDTLTA